MSVSMSAFGNILLGGIFHAAVLFLVAAGLQLVFGVQKIVNLACGSFYALGAYFGITFVTLALKAGTLDLVQQRARVHVRDRPVPLEMIPVRGAAGGQEPNRAGLLGPRRLGEHARHA